MSHKLPHEPRTGTEARSLPAPATSRRRHSRTLWRGVAAAGLLGVLALAAPVNATEEATPSLQRADIAVTLQPDGTTRTRAAYELSAADDAPIPHRVLPRSGTEFTGLQLTGAGPVAPADATTYPVPVDDTRYTLVSTSRSADPAAGDVPIPVPDIPTAADATVQIKVTLPDGQQLVGDSLPALTSGEQNSSSVLSHSGPAVPSAVIAPYGTQPAFTLGDALSAAGLVALAVTCLLWFRHTHRDQRRPLDGPPGTGHTVTPSHDRSPVAATHSRRPS